MNNEALKMEDDMLKKVDKFIQHFDNQWEEKPEPFTLEIVE